MSVLLAACGGGGGGGGGSGGGTDPIGNPGVDGSPYFPFAVGDRWRYQSDGMPSDARVTGTRSTSAGEAFVVEFDDQGSISEQLFVKNASGVRLVPGAGADPIEAALGAVTLVRFPVRTGVTDTVLETTISPLDLDGDGRLDQIVVRVQSTPEAFEPLVLAAGSFPDTLRLKTVITQTVTLTRDNRRVTITTTVEDWYARDIGLVRSRSTTSDGISPPDVSDETVTGWRVGTRSSDLVPPTVVARSPEPGSNVQVALISVRFSEDMNTRVLDPNTIRVSGPGGSTVAGSARWRDGRTLEFSLLPSLPRGRYTVTLQGTVEDLLGNRLAGPVEWGFDLDGSGPLLVSRTPADGATDAAPDSTIVLTFDEPLSASSVFSAGIGLQANFRLLPISVRVDGNRLIVTPGQPLGRGVVHEVLLAGVVSDAAGNASSLSGSYRFTVDPGRFGLPEVPTALASALSVERSILEDLSGDGQPDLLFVRRVVGTTGNQVTEAAYVRRNADGSLAASATPIPLACEASIHQSVGDLNGDGRVDLASSSLCGLVWSTQNADGSFSAQAPIGPNPGVTGVQVIPRASGGAAIAAILGGNTLRLFQPAAGGGFEAGGDLINAGAEILGGLQRGDFNGDSRQDLAVIRLTPGGATVLVLALQRADGSFEITNPLPGSAGSILAVADVDGDGRTDLVLTSPGGTPQQVRLLRQSATGGFDAPVVINLPHVPIGTAVTVADLDRDGRRDIVYLRFDDQGRTVFDWVAQKTAGGFVASPLTEFAQAPSLGNPTQPVVADLTGDGALDLMHNGLLLRQRPGSGSPLAQGPGVNTSQRLGGALQRLRGVN